MDSEQFQLIMSSIDDVKGAVRDCYAEVKETNKHLADHIEDDRKLANEVWFMKRAVQTTWGVAVAGIGIGLTWMGLGQK